MISTAIRAATPLHRGCRAMVDGYDRTEAAKHCTRRSPAIEAAAASLHRRVRGLGEDRDLVVNWYSRTRRARSSKDIGRSSASPVENEMEEKELEAAAESPPQKAAKICVECGTSVTPMWRPGPQGPKSLCNACGIKYRRAKKKSGGAGGGAGKIITVPISATFPEGQVASMSSPLRVVNTEEVNKGSGARDPRGVLLLVWEGQKQRRKKRRPAAPASTAAPPLSQCSQEEADAALLLMSLSTSAATAANSSALLVRS